MSEMTFYIPWGEASFYKEHLHNQVYYYIFQLHLYLYLWNFMCFFFISLSLRLFLTKIGSVFLFEKKIKKKNFF
jgi:hypothetical protein